MNRKTRRASGKAMLTLTLRTLMTILLLSASAWAANHQICYQLPPPAGTQKLQARFLCRMDGATGGPCDITSVNPDPFTSGFASHQGNVFYGGGQNGADFNLSAPGTYVGTITFNDGTVRSCTVAVSQGAFIDRNLQLTGYTTDASGLVMTGVWQGISAPADQAMAQVFVPPDFVAVGGGAEGTEFPNGTLVSGSYNPSNPRSWLGSVHSNTPFGVPPQISPVTVFGIGLKIQGILIATLTQTVKFPSVGSYVASGNSYEANPTAKLTGPSIGNYLGTGGADPTVYPQTLAVISGGAQAQQASSPKGQYVTATQPVFAQQCYFTGPCEQVVQGWVTSSKEHINPSPWWVTGQVTTLPKTLTINGSTFHVETWVSNATSAQLAHPSASATLPGDFALTGVGAFVNWQTSPSAEGNMLWRLKPRPDINGTEAASKDQWFSSPATITAYAIGMKLVPGPLPAPAITVVPVFFPPILCLKPNCAP